MGLRMSTPWKHPDSGTYYLNQRVPTDLVAKVKGRTVIITINGDDYAVKLGNTVKLSLRTKEPKLAKERFSEAVAAVQELWRVMRQETHDGPVCLSTKQIEALAGEYYRDLCERFEDEPGDPEEWAMAMELAGDQRGNITALERTFGAHLDWLLSSKTLVIDDASRAKVLAAMNRATVQVAQYQKRRADGDFRPDEYRDRFPVFEPTTLQSSAKGSGSGESFTTLSDLFTLWESEHQRNGGAEKTIRDFRQKVESLAAFLGHEDVDRITARELVKWTDHLIDERELSAKTVRDKHLAAVKAVFKVGIRRFKIETDPSAGVSVKVGKKFKVRDTGFSDQEAKTILSAALKVTEGNSRMSNLNRLAIRWGTWIAAHTGARISEIMQLRKQDFEEHAGIPCIRITPEAGSTKTGEFRLIPIHPQLIDMGLLDFVQSAPTGYLFIQPGETPSATRTRAGSAGTKVSEWVRRVAGITDKNVQPNHGWRHRFKTVARDLGEERMADAMQGHADGRAATSYGTITVQAMNRLVQRMPWF
jgi:integrase